MELMENIKRFGKILEASVPNERGTLVTEVARSLIMADIAHIGDPDRGKYEHLSLCGLAMCHIPEYQGVDKSHGDSGEEALSDVMQMRIMCDTLTLLLEGDQPYAMRYTADVAKAMGQRVRTGVGRYLEYDECEKILDSYYDALPTYDESLRPVFERTSYYLKSLDYLRKYTSVIGEVLTDTCMQNIWLPAEFDSYGFAVTNKMPKVFNTVQSNFDECVQMYNIAYIMDSIIKCVTRNGSGTSAGMMFVTRLRALSKLAPDKLPIGVAVQYGIRPDVYYPSHFIVNDAVRSVYEHCFSTKKPLGITSVDDGLELLYSYHKIG